MQARVYLYDLYYHLPNYGLGKVLNSHDICIVAFKILQNNFSFPHHFIQTENNVLNFPLT